jgi:hypothetical protein
MIIKKMRRIQGQVAQKIKTHLLDILKDKGIK